MNEGVWIGCDFYGVGRELNSAKEGAERGRGGSSQERRCGGQGRRDLFLRRFADSQPVPFQCARFRRLASTS